MVKSERELKVRETKTIYIFVGLFKTDIDLKIIVEFLE